MSLVMIRNRLNLRKKNVCHKLISIIFIGPVQFTCIYFEINSQTVQLFLFVTFAHTLKVIQIDEKQTFSILRLRTMVVFFHLYKIVSFLMNVYWYIDLIMVN